MPDKKLNDNEIKKALEDLVKCNNNEIDCGSCSLNVFYPRCPEEIGELSLDLINRLQARVEYYKQNRNKYQDDVMYLSKQLDNLQVENEDLKREREALIEDIHSLSDQVNEQQEEIGRLSTLAKLGNTRANDYRVMRDRALKAEAEVERLQKSNRNWRRKVQRLREKNTVVLLKPENAKFENLEHFETRQISKEMLPAIVRRAKADAYKEFWKELYVELRMYGQQEKFTKSVFLSVADKVLTRIGG